MDGSRHGDEGMYDYDALLPIRQGCDIGAVLSGWISC